jgi:oligo-alginate lyase
VEKVSEATWADRHFFEASNPKVQAMSAKADRYYPGVGMQRTMLLVRDARLPYPVVLDLYRLASATPHAYDYPVHFRGQLVASSVKYTPNTTRLEPLGAAHGYQHLWREAQGTTDTTVQATWLAGQRYYTVTTAGAPGTEVLFARTGANDPNFNLVVEPMLLVRRRAADHLFASIIEPHGYWSEPQERSEQARPRLTNVRVLAATAEGSVVEVTGQGGIRWTVMVNNGPADPRAEHNVTADGKTYTWTGNWVVRGVQ